MTAWSQPKRRKADRVFAVSSASRRQFGAGHRQCIELQTTSLAHTTSDNSLVLLDIRLEQRRQASNISQKKVVLDKTRLEKSVQNLSSQHPWLIVDIAAQTHDVSKMDLRNLPLTVAQTPCGDTLCFIIPFGG